MTRLSDGASDGMTIMVRFWPGSCNRVETRAARRVVDRVMRISCDLVVY